MSPVIMRDAIVAVLFGGLALASILFLIPSGVESPGSIQQAALSPAFWPKVIAWSTLVASAMLLVETFGTSRMGTSTPDEEASDEDLGMLVGLIRAVGLVVFLFVYYMSLDRYGIVVPSIVLLPLLMLYFGERNPLTIGICSIALPVILYGFFRYIAGIAVPLGIFG